MNVPEVLIGGVRYVPVSDAHIGARAIEDALLEQYWGDDWRTKYPEALRSSRVIVAGEPEDDSDGETVPEFVARLLSAAEAITHGGQG